jgi:hypothetical protein
MMYSRLAFVVIVGALLQGCHYESSQSASASSWEQDGISAALGNETNKILAHWRFTKSLTTPLKDIVASINDRPLGVPTVEYYPDSASQTAIILMLDLTDSRREAQIDENEIALIRILGRAAIHHQIAVQAYSDTVQYLTPPNEDIGNLFRMIVALQPADQPAHLGLILANAIRTLGRRAADRRGIFILSDGHSDDALDVVTLTDLAKRNDVALTFVLTPSHREIDAPALTTLASASGGEIIDRDRREMFLHAPFELLDSGATARFPLDGARRYFWEPDANIKVVFRYGDRTLELSSPASSIRVAGPFETSKYLVDMHPIPIAGIGGIIMASCIGVIALSRRRKIATSTTLESMATADPSDNTQSPLTHSILETTTVTPTATTPSESTEPPAFLEDVENGTIYGVSGAQVQIGRDLANDIILQDMTVSRFHAVLARGPDGTFSIKNRSGTNPTLINYQPAAAARLNDGDVLQIGATKLRYRQSNLQSK